MPQNRVLSLVSMLLPLHQLESRAANIVDISRLLTGDSLQSLPAHGTPRRSTLTTDGTPFELSLSLTASDPGGLRYAADVGNLQATLRDRLRQGTVIAGQLLDRAGAAHLLPVHQRIMSLLFAEELFVADNCRFGLWHGMVHRAERADEVRLYYNLRPCGRQTHVALNKILSALSDYLDVHPLQIWANRLPFAHPPVILCVHYTGEKRVKVKIYYWPREQVNKDMVHVLVSACGLEGYWDAYELFHQTLAGPRQDYAERSLLYYLSADVIDQAPSLSIYLTVRNYVLSDMAALNRLTPMLEQLGINPFLYQQTLTRISPGPLSAEHVRTHTLAGIGLSPGRLRMNFYFKPTLT